MAEKILIVDDDIDTLRLLSLMLKKQGYQTVVAHNGSQGLLKMSEESPDLVLLDVMMPEMDGYEVARRLRSNPETTKVPILMFTAKSQASDKAIGFAAGVDDYLTKPTTPMELQEHVKALLARSVKADPEQILPQPARSEKTGSERTPRRVNRTATENIVDARFSAWFKDNPSNKVS